MRIVYQNTYTYKIFKLFETQVKEFVSTIGEIVTYGLEFLKGLKNFNTSFKE